MKSPVLLSTICIALGVAIGWFARPVAPAAPVEQSQDAGKKTRPAGEPSSRVTSNRREVTSSSRDPLPDEDPTETEEMPNREAMDSRFADILKKRQQQKLDARIAKLIAELNLSPAQEAELRKILAAQMDGLDGLQSGDFDPANLAGISGLMNGKAVDEALAGLLTDEQKEAHEALQERELGNKVEARALKELAKLSSLDLSQEQKDQVYDILYKEAEASVEARANSPENAMISAITEEMGIELDPDDLGIPGGFITGAAIEGSQNGGEIDPKEMMARMKEAREENVNRKVEALRPVLNERQLEQYRSDLQRKSGGILGGFLGGFGDDPEGE